jgi:molecular chaperone DnaJ
MSAASYYEILGVARNASEKEIKEAYRSLARRYHPDICKEEGAEDKFKQINEAFQVLSNPQKRAQYDRFGHDTFTNTSRGGHQSGGYGGFHADFSNFGSFSDIFDSFFGQDPWGSRQNRGPVRGADLLMRLQITLEEAVFGADREVEVLHTERCPACEGTGSATKKRQNCARCGGSGQLRQVSHTVFGQFVRVGICSECKGRGKVPEKNCANCSGTGQSRVKRMVTVHIPAGIETGMRLRLEGYGEAGEYEAPSGDLYIEVVVKPHDRFTRAGDDLETPVEISPAQATLGSSVGVGTIDGKQVDLTIPSGTQAGATLRVAGEGVKKRGRRGDLLVKVRIVVPKTVSSEEKELYAKLLEIEGKKKPEKKGFFRNLWE